MLTSMVHVCTVSTLAFLQGGSKGAILVNFFAFIDALLDPINVKVHGTVNFT